MSYKHGISISEIPTALTPMTQVSAPTVALGTASKGTTLQPVLIHSFDAFKEEFGFTEDFATNTLEEVAYCFFVLFNVRPVVFINVPASDAEDGVTNADVIDALSQIDRVYPRLSLVPGMIIAPKFSANPQVALAMAAKARLINGVFRSIALCDINAPANLTANENPTADRLVADKGIARDIESSATNRVLAKDARNNLLADDTLTADTNFTAINTFKTQNNLVDEFLIDCWPRVAFGEYTYWLSTQAAALMNLVDASNGQIPYESPSNKLLRCDRSLNQNDSQIALGFDEANTLNSWGVVTALNFNAWRLWGNRVSIYPDEDDPKDSFIACRRMLNWLSNTLAINYFSRIDNPLNRRLVESVIDEVNLFIAGLTSQGVLLGGRVAFLEDDNPTINLADGLMKFRVYVGLVTPARHIEFSLTFDTSYFATLFG